jgi:hypothetical protein
VDAIINKLVEYQILEERSVHFTPKKENRRGTLFLINDFYLNLYFSVLKENQSNILKNKKRQFILKSILSKNGYHIPGFTGEAFENLIIQILRGYFNNENEPTIIKLLHLNGQEYEVSSNWNPQLQIDVLVTNANDRTLRAIECKWTEDPKLIMTALDTIKYKSMRITESENLQVLPALVSPIPAYTKAIKNKAKELGVILISGSDLIYSPTH